MQGWHTTFLGMRGLPRDISDFEMKAFFTFDARTATQIPPPMATSNSST